VEFEELEIQKEKDLITVDIPDYHIWGINVTAHGTKSSNEMLDNMPKHENISAIETTYCTPGEEIQAKVARTFKVGLDTAKKTLAATTQLALRHTLHPVHGRYRTQVVQLRIPGYPTLMDDSTLIHSLPAHQVSQDVIWDSCTPKMYILANSFQ